jgi:hypothetical protein
MSIDLIEKEFSLYFPQKQISDITDLVSCAQSIACTGKDIDISRLFDHTDVAESPFLQLLWQQALDERELLSRLLQVSMFQFCENYNHSRLCSLTKSQFY